MIRKISTVLASALLTTTLATSAMAAKEKKVLLKVPTTFPTHLVGLGTPVPKFAKSVMSMTDSIKVKVYEPKKLVAPFEILDAVSSGKVNAGWATAAYWKGKIPSAPLFSAVPFGPEAPEYVAWLYYGNGSKLYQEMYDKHGYNVKVIPCSIIAPETSGWFKNEINKPEDLKGLKMRFLGLGADVMNKLGVATTLLPGGEIFPALEKGALDATEFSMPVIDERLGFHKIVKYNYFPGWHQQATLFELLINKKTWNKMSDKQQNIIQTACKANITDSLAEGEASQFDAMKKNEEKNGVIIKTWSPEMLATFRTKWGEVVEEQKADPFFAKVWADLNGFSENYGVWKKRAFLPR